MARVTLPQRTNAEAAPKRLYTTRQLNTKMVLHDIIAVYDNLLAEYNSNPTNTNQKRVIEYAHHLRSANKLSDYFQKNYKTFTTLDVLESDTKIRDVIRYELEDGGLVKVDGLIRNPNTVPYDNISATGNTITILIPSTHIDRLVEKLKVALVNESARIIVPCNNMIIVIETGEFTNVINDGLYHTVCEVVTTYTCNDYFLKPQKPSHSIKIVIN